MPNPVDSERLQIASVLIVGAGGLGSPAAHALAAAGIGRLGIVDADRVDLSNLHRQVLHHTADIGRLKVDSARDRLAALFPGVRVETYAERLTAERAREWFPRYGFVLDGSDNFATKYLVNAAGIATGTPFVYGGILRFEGQLLTVTPGRSACYRCLFREPPAPGLIPDCQEAGVLGALAGVMGSLQAAEAVNFFLDRPLMTDRLLVYQALEARFREVRFRRDPSCPACGVARDPGHEGTKTRRE